MNKVFAIARVRSLGKAALVAGAIAAPLAITGAASAQAAPAQTIAPIKSDVCISGPLGFIQGCVDSGRHRWWDGNRWWNGDRAWDGDDWRRSHDGAGWRDNNRGRDWHDHDRGWHGGRDGGDWHGGGRGGHDGPGWPRR